MPDYFAFGHGVYLKSDPLTRCPYIFLRIKRWWVQIDTKDGLDFGVWTKERWEEYCALCSRGLDA